MVRWLRSTKLGCRCRPFLLVLAAVSFPATAHAQPAEPSASTPAGILLPPPVSPSMDSTEHERFVANERRLARIERLVRQDEERERRAREEQEKWWGWTKMVHLSGYVQPQLLWQWVDTANASPNYSNGSLPPGVGANSVIAKADTVFASGAPGLTTNGDYFRLRRARLTTEVEPSEWSRFVMQIEPILAGGPDNATGTIARNVEADGIARWSLDVTTTFGMGIFKVPFGYEILQSNADKPFIESSWMERNLFPGDFDTGAKAETTALHNRLTVQVAVINGETQGEKTFSLLPDLKQGKDLVARVSYDLGPFDVGASGYYGQGAEVVLSGLDFKPYPRYAWNLEAAIHHRFLPVGGTRIFAELDRGQNMDRGVNYAAAIALPGLPASANIANGPVVNKDELGYWARLEQDITRWSTLGLRYDKYTPDSAQASNSRDTYAVVGVAHFTEALQLMLEYDYYIDNVHAPGAAIPYKKGDLFSGVLQVRFP